MAFRPQVELADCESPRRFVSAGKIFNSKALVKYVEESFWYDSRAIFGAVRNYISAEQRCA
jgi:hypothetical protein